MEQVLSSPVLGIVVSIAAYGVGVAVRRRWASPLANPLAIAVVLIILALKVTPLSYEHYRPGGDVVAMFIVPATTVLAVHIHRQWARFRANLLPILAGCLAGSAASILTIWGMCRLLGIERTLAASLLPKSVTTAIAMELSVKAGGVASIAVSAVIFTGIFSVVFSPLLVRFLKLKGAEAIGVGLGVSGHAIATAKALELGEVEGAMSGIALVMAGVVTSVLFLFLP